MFNAKFSSADEVYESIYKQAKSSIYVVDNYIGLRTLVHLKNSPTGVDIILFSDNVGNNKLHNIEFIDFCKEYPSVKISIERPVVYSMIVLSCLIMELMMKEFSYVVLHQRMQGLE